MRISKWLIKVFGYLLYTLAVLAVMLWFQFPVVAVKTRLEHELRSLTPDLQWKIGRINLAMPADIRLSDIKISDNRKSKEPLFVIDSLSLRPALWAYLKDKKLSAGYRLGILDGSVNGQLSLTDDHNILKYDGNANGIKITGLKKILQDLDRTLSGTLSGSFTGKGAVHGSGAVELEGNVKLLKGEIGFREPVLGMEKLAFNRVSSRLQYGTEGIRFVDGMIESRLLAGDFTGTVKPVAGIGRSTLRLNGALIPRPEFLSSIGDATAVNMVKSQLQGKKLPFIISGTLEEPGIVFTGLPADFNQRPQGGGK